MKVSKFMPKPKVIAGALLATLMLLGLGLMPPALAESTAFHDVTVDVAYDMITNGDFPDLVILDVRYQHEYDNGHLYEAVLIPYDELETRTGELEEHKSHEIIVYCRSGYRSKIARQTLADHNFTKVYNMLGGILEWMAGYPIYTTLHHATVNIVDGETLLQIEPMPIPTSRCPCEDECPPSESQTMFVNLTVLEQEEDHVRMLLAYELNGTTLEVTIATSRLWSYAEVTGEYNRTAMFMKTEIAAGDEFWQFHSLSYVFQCGECVLTLYTRLKPLDSETFETSFTEMNCAPTGESKVLSMEFVEVNSSVTLSQLYAVLGKVAKEIGKVYEKSGNEELAQLAQSYYTMEEEAKYLSKLVEKQLQEYDREILESSAILLDHPQTCFWVLWWEVCIDWCTVLVGVVGTIIGPGCMTACCVALPPLCPWCAVICEVINRLSGHALYMWCVGYFNCVIQWLTI